MIAEVYSQNEELEETTRGKYSTVSVERGQISRIVIFGNSLVNYHIYMYRIIIADM